MNTRHDNADGPEDIDAAFAEIVAGLERDAPMARWPDDISTDAPRSEGNQSAQPEDLDSGPSGSRWPEPDSSADWAASPAENEDEEGHYEPPEPPPLPTPRPSTLGGIVLIGLGVTLLLVPGLAGLGATVALPLGLISISGGITWLLFRLRHSPSAPGDDGAQL